MTQRRARYADAIQWIVDNDDTAFLTETIGDEIVLSVSASLVADLFSRTDAEVAADLRRALKRTGARGKLPARATPTPKPAQHGSAQPTRNDA